MKIKIFHMKISSVRENENFSRKCELWGFLVSAYSAPTYDFMSTRGQLYTMGKQENNLSWYKGLQSDHKGKQGKTLYQRGPCGKS